MKEKRDTSILCLPAGGLLFFRTEDTRGLNIFTKKGAGWNGFLTSKVVPRRFIDRGNNDTVPRVSFPPLLLSSRSCHYTRAVPRSYAYAVY